MIDERRDLPGDTERAAFHGNFPSQLSSIVAIRRAVEQVAAECGATPQVVENVKLATSEAATNALLHGGSGGADSKIMVRAKLDGTDLHVVIADHGRGMLAPGQSEGLGLGMKIIESMTDRMELVTDGANGATEVHMYFSCGA